MKETPNRVRLILASPDSFVKGMSLIIGTNLKLRLKILGHFFRIKVRVSNNLIESNVEPLVIHRMRRVPRFDFQERIEGFIHWFTFRSEIYPFVA